MDRVVSKGKEKILPIVNELDTDMIGTVKTVEKIPQKASITHGIGESFKSPLTEP